MIDPDQRPSGVVFKVQQKGQRGGLDASRSNLVLGGLRVDRVRYLLDTLRIPGVLVGVDVDTGEVYWRVIQGDPTLRADCDAATANAQLTMTVRLPVTNRLPGTEQALLAGVERASRAIAMRLVLQLDATGLNDAIHAAGVDPRTEPLRSQADRVRMLALWERFSSDDPTLFDECVLLLEAKSETLEMRLYAGDLMVRIVRLTEHHQLEVHTRHKVYEYLLGVVRHRGAARHHQRLVVYGLRGARLQSLADQFLSLTHAHELAKAHGDASLVSMTGVAAGSVATRLFGELGRLNRSILRLPAVGLSHVVPVAWARLVMDLAPFAVAMRATGMGSQVDQMIHWLEQYTQPCIDVCNHVEERGPDVAAALAGLLLLSDLRDEEGLRQLLDRYTSWAEAIESDDVRAQVLEALEGNAQVIRNRRDPGEPPSFDDMRETFERMAHGLGINLAGDDLAAQVVRAGLADLDPTRVLAHCEHLYLRFEGGGLPAQLTGLWSAGRKTVFCRRHPHHGRGGLALDGIWPGFQRDHCSGCPDRIPQQPNWRWSLEEQERQDADVALHGILKTRETS